MPFVLSVTSGKGGVGKTTLSVNLSLSLSKMGLKVLLFDGDFGLANAEIMLRVMPELTLKDYFFKGRSLQEILVKGPYGLFFLTSYSGMKEVFEEYPEKAEAFVKEFEKLCKPFDMVVIDTGAGIGKKVTRLNQMADLILVLMNKEPTSLTDAYGVIKVMAGYGKKNFGVVVNRVLNQKEAEEAYKRLSEATKKFLGFSPEFLGFLPEDGAVPRSISLQRPARVAFSTSPFSKKVDELSRTIYRMVKNGALQVS